eukprot:m.37227 g.37227  ORF g.37227 m.37227 type:complete len:148 (+) comp17604_c0_seq2:234-677(+)
MADLAEATQRVHLDETKAPVAPKGILKNKSRGIVWDEDNIKATFHPADKDYGHMKIDEPNTPYEPPLSLDGIDDIPDLNLGESVQSTKENPTSAKMDTWDEDEPAKVVLEKKPDNDDSKFSQLRKDHYDMKAAMARAKLLIAEEDDE